VEREYLLVKCAGLDIAICDIHVGGLRYILTEWVNFSASLYPIKLL